MEIKKIYIGGWFQRTLLHLREVYDFLRDAESPLDFDKNKLDKLRKNLKIKNVKIEISDFDYVEFETEDGIEIKIYEDGLITLNTDNQELKKILQNLQIIMKTNYQPL